MEEEQVFPRFKQALSEEQNAKITALVNQRRLLDVLTCAGGV